MGTSFSIDGIIGQSWEAIKKYFLIFLGSMFIYFIISTIISVFTSGVDLFTMSQYPNIGQDISSILFYYFNPLRLFGYFISIIIGSYFNLCWYNMGLFAARGIEPTLDCFKHSAKKIFNSIIANIIVSIIVCIGFVCCIIPGIILTIRFQFFYMNIIEKDMGILDSISESWNQTRGYTMDLFLLGLMYFLINIVGLLCCCVGLLVTIPMTIIGLSIAFLKLKELKEGGPEITEDVKVEPVPVPAPSESESLAPSEVESSDPTETKPSTSDEV